MITKKYFSAAIHFLCLMISVSVFGQASELRVLTYNIHHANPPSKTGVIDVDAIARVIKNSKADIVALQEVDRNTGRSGKLDQAKIIAEKTGLHFEFFKAIDHDGGDYGIAILSIFPLKKVATVYLPQKVVDEKRVLGYAIVKINGKQMIFANTHLDAMKSDENRVVQMQHILNVFSKEKYPVILCGDLNSVAGSETINLLDKQFKRTCVKDCKGTLPEVNPRVTIDYVATKNVAWPLLSYDVIEETYASDHRPVLATFKIK